MLLDHEKLRVAALRQYDVLDTPPEEHFDRITAMAARLFDSEYSCISLVDEERFFFKSAYGADITEIHREPGFCDVTIKKSSLHCIEDTNRDPSVQNHSMVCKTPFIRFYAGSPLITSDGFAIGTLCVMDPVARRLSSADRELLEELSEYVMFLLDRRKMQAEREHQEERVQNAQKLESLGILTSGIAHDFNNLLVGVLGNASVAASHIGQDGPAMDAIVNVTNAANQAKDLTDQLLAYAGQRPGTPAPIDLADLLQSLTVFIRSTIPKNKTLKLDLEEDLPMAIGNESQLRQVVVNLVTNAAEAYGNGAGTITVRLSEKHLTKPAAGKHRFDDPEPGRYLEVEVADQGCGMDTDTLRSMFDPYFSTKLSGRGLGMSIVQRVVRGHGGTIQADSAEGEGCVVSVLLPASPVQKTAPAEQTAVSNPDLNGGGTVLVVDDEDLVVRTTCSAIEQLGFNAISAPGGAEALQILNDETDFKVLVLDATLPEVPGDTILEQIRQRRPQLPTVITSGHHVDEVAGRYRDFDQLTFLSKPWTVEELAGALDDALARQC